MSRSRSHTTALILTGLLGAADIASVGAGDGKHPPLAVGIAGAVLGVITLVALGLLVTGRAGRGAVRTIVVSRAVSALSATPAFFVGGVPAAATAAAVLVIVVTVIALALLAPELRRPSHTA